MVPNLSHIVEQSRLTRDIGSFHNGILKTHIFKRSAFDHSIRLHDVRVVVLVVVEIKLGWGAQLSYSSFNREGKWRQLVQRTLSGDA
jgi:hypothetical protein